MPVPCGNPRRAGGQPSRHSEPTGIVARLSVFGCRKGGAERKSGRRLEEGVRGWQEEVIATGFPGSHRFPAAPLISGLPSTLRRAVPWPSY